MSQTNLLLIPGLLCTARLWRDQITALSDMADISIAEHRLDDNVSDIARRILADAPDRFALAGLSMGGYIAFELYRQAPERIERLALLDTRATEDSAEDTKRRKDLLALADQGKFNGISEKLMPLFIHHDRLADRKLVNDVIEMASETGKQGFVNQTKALMARQDSRELCKSINVPTMVLCGRQDVITPLHMHEEIADLIPDSDLIVVEACGHLSTMELPEAVNHALREWLMR